MRTAGKLETSAGDRHGKHQSYVHLAVHGLPAIDASFPAWGSARRRKFSDGHSPDMPVGGVVKRRFDIAVAASLLVLLSPLLLATALLLRFGCGGSVIFAHRRVGFGGRPFHCYKFRTMVPNGDEVLGRYLAAHPECAEEWQTTQKLRNDPRVTFIGHVVRKSSLDELPQLVNVLKGDMSCIGPRPVVESELERYGADREYYQRARPGISGLWQVSGRNSLSYATRVAMDCDYVRNWSLKRDILILLKTIPAVLRAGDTS